MPGWNTEGPGMRYRLIVVTGSLIVLAVVSANQCPDTYDAVLA